MLHELPGTAMPERAAPLELARLLGVLREHEVDFVVVGGLAAIAHGSRRMTLDLDVIPRPDAANFERLATAIDALGVPPGVVGDGRFASIDPRDSVDLARSHSISLRTVAGQLDILNAASSAPPYDELQARGVALEIAGIPVCVVGLDDLIAMKQASGRPKDLQDVADITAHELE